MYPITLIRHRRTWLVGLLLGLACATQSAVAADATLDVESALDAESMSVPDAWARAAYEIPQADRRATFTALADRAREAAKEKTPATLIWKGICLSTLAGEKNSLASLKLAREARGAFRAAMQLDEQALEGAAQVSLGALYYRLPVFPVSFGSKRKARRLLTRALEISPKSMDANYFMADFLFTIGDAETARQHVEVGLSAPIRPERSVADRGRQGELKRLLEKIDNPNGDAAEPTPLVDLPGSANNPPTG